MTEIVLVVVGLFAGALAAALGVGGGIVFVPALVLLLDYPQHLAQGTSLAVILPTAIVGTVVHARRSRVDWATAIPIAAGGVLGAVVGAAAALSVDGDVLRRLFAVFLAVLAFRMLWMTRRSPATDGDVDDAR